MGKKPTKTLGWYWLMLALFGLSAAMLVSCAGPSAYRAARDAGCSKWDSFLWAIPPR